MKALDTPIITQKDIAQLQEIAIQEGGVELTTMEAKEGGERLLEAFRHIYIPIDTHDQS